MSNMNKLSLDPNGEHVSPLGNSRVDVGYANIAVKLLKWPDEKTFKSMVFKATTATRGNDIHSTEFDEQVIEDAFKGGLNQCLEWDTLVFECSGVSRGLTHELVRTRRASFAQQSMRHTNMGNPDMRMPTAIHEDLLASAIWLSAIEHCKKAYRLLVQRDIPFQDARTVLPIATQTYIIAEYPVSEFLATYSYRACHMFYPEIVYLFHLMKQVTIDKCPWLEPYIKISCEKTASRDGFDHQCTYQVWERVEGHCPLAWARESNRVWKSRKFSS